MAHTQKNLKTFSHQKTEMRQLLILLIIVSFSIGCKKYTGDEIPDLPPLQETDTNWREHGHSIFGIYKLLLGATVQENEYRAVSAGVFLKIAGDSKSVDGSSGWSMQDIDIRYKPEFSQLSFAFNTSNAIRLRDSKYFSQNTSKFIYYGLLNHISPTLKATQLAHGNDIGAFTNDEFFVTTVNREATPNAITVVWIEFTREDFNNNGIIELSERQDTKLGDSIFYTSLPAETNTTSFVIESFYNYAFISTEENAYRVSRDGQVDKIFSTTVKDFFQDDKYLYADAGTAIFYSSDFGKNWQLKKNNLNSNQERNFFYAQPYLGYYFQDSLFVANENFEFKSVDNTTIASNKIVGVHRFTDSVFVATNNGLFVKGIKDFAK